MNPEKCRYMEAAYPGLVAEDTCGLHRHDAPTFALARELAGVIQGVEPTEEQIGWVLDDAAGFVDDFEEGQTEWNIEAWRPVREPGLIFRMTVNGQEYVVPESEWDTAHPVSDSEWMRWNDE